MLPRGIRRPERRIRCGEPRQALAPITNLGDFELQISIERNPRPVPSAQYARFFVSIIRRISGVRMICMASGSLPPGTTSVFGRDMNESWITDSR